MPGGIDKVEFVGFAIHFIIEGDRVHLNRDAPFAFEIHIIKHLITKVSLSDSACF